MDKTMSTSPFAWLPLIWSDIQRQKKWLSGVRGSHQRRRDMPLEVAIPLIRVPIPERTKT